MKKYVLGFLCFLLIFPAMAHAEGERKIAIVIDDFGNNMKGTEKMLSLPIPLSIAVMPFLPSTKQDAEMAHKKGYEVLVHLPMEPIRGKKSWLGPNAITTDLSDEEIKKRVEMAIADVPHAIGMNNHMGSKATADERVMRIVLSVCKTHGFFYLDSKTNSKSKVLPIAKELGVPVIENNMFFDDQYTHTHIAKQAALLLKRVKTANTTVIIGHVGPPGEITSSVIRTNIPNLKQEATFVFVSKLAEKQK
ncbi:divergent polysaccharide deacetylase family protein [Ectobacillus polymachus]|uniref:divergent polysaccharide deacetylase family protein n=1 Tax=Ectobacillus polymachus TaxID=1508806 RepID=UPI003A839F11